MASLTLWEDQAIHALSPDGHWRAKSIDQIDWLSGTTPVSKADIQAKAAELEAADAVVVAQKEAVRASAISKLEALGLTSAEIDTIKNIV